MNALDHSPRTVAQLLSECAAGRRSWQDLPTNREASVRALRDTLADLPGHPRIDPRSVRIVGTDDARHVTCHAVWPDGERRVLGFTVRRDGQIVGALALRGGQHVGH